MSLLWASRTALHAVASGVLLHALKWLFNPSNAISTVRSRLRRQHSLQMWDTVARADLNICSMLTLNSVVIFNF